MANLKFLNKNVTITRSGILSQDFKTNDGKIEVKARRIGGGFSQGRNVYDVFKNGKQKLRGVSVGKAYDFTESYLKGARKASSKIKGKASNA